MKISIGKTLRRLRIEKGLTQEQLAEVLNVSAQAVSRWENDQAYPDIALLPGLAVYYGVSVDEIIGMEGIRKEERIHSAMSEIYTQVRQGNLEDALDMIRENLRLYPDNSSLLMALSETLARKEDDEEALKEAIAVSERVLRGNEISMKARSTAMVNLMLLYLKAGRREEAEALVGSLPHIWESREMVMPETSEGQAYHQELKKAVRKALVFLCEKIEMESNRKLGETPEYIQLGVTFKRTETNEELLERIKRFLAE